MNKKTPNSVSKDEHFVQVALAFLILVVALWWMFNEEVTKFYIFIMTKQITFMHEIGMLIGVHSEGMHNFLEVIGKKPFGENITIADLIVIAENGEKYTKWMNIGMFLMVVIYIFIKRISSAQTNYNRTFTGDSLIEEKAKTKPCIRPILHLEFGQDDEERGAFTWMQSPFEWATERGIIVDKSNPGKTKDTFDPNKCKVELLKDIKSDVFRGVEPSNMDLPRRFIFAAYSLWYCEKYDLHNKLLEEGAKWFKVDNSDKKNHKYEWNVPTKWVQKINKWCKDGLNEKRIKKIIDTHVFQDTVLKAMMSQIPKTTVAYYIWLKAINKNLFYTMHQTGMEVCAPFVKGISEIYDMEVKNKLKGKRLISKSEQKSLTKRDIISRLDVTSWISDIWWSLESTGFMNSQDIIDLSDEELRNLESTGHVSREIDITKPIHMYYIEAKGSRDGTRTINTVIFYDPFENEVLKQIKIPKGRMDSASKSTMEWYLYNNYIYVADSDKVRKWLIARGINKEIMFYDIVWDAAEAYGNPNIKSQYDIEVVTGYTYQEMLEKSKSGDSPFVAPEHRMRELFTTVKNKINLIYEDSGVKNY